MIKEKLEALKLPYPDLSKSHSEWRKEAFDVIFREEYGFLPDNMPTVECELVNQNERAFASKATTYNYNMKFTNENGTHVLPFIYSCPNGDGKYPAIIHINFRQNFPDIYTPAEEIIDNGFAVATFCYKDVTMDNTDYTDGLAGLLYGGDRKNDTDASKILLWAWTASRVLDFLYTQDKIDTSKVAVCGHSRLGKTALVTGAIDERFSLVYSNESGCSGAAISRDKVGESIDQIYNMCPHWSCYNYAKYRNNEHGQPFDQHYLTALIAPRLLYIASAIEDTWADPDAEYLCAVAANAFYDKLGVTGFIHPDRLPVAGDVFHEGNVAYHVRPGTHYFSRTDWFYLMAFAQKKWNMI